MSKPEKSTKKKVKAEKKEQSDAVAAPKTTKVATEDAPLSNGKEKKRKRDDEAHVDEPKKSKKSKKQKVRKSTSVEEAAVSQTAQEETAETTTSKKDKKDKKDKKSKKSKSSKTTEDASEAPATNGTVAADFIPLEESKDSTVNGSETNKASKKKSKKKKSYEKEDASATQDKAVASADAENTQQDGDGDVEMQDAPSGKKNRFVVFVGNLPFSATKEELQKHFESIAPTDIRLMTDKVTKKPKGFAFLEFDRFDRMETCLKKYNHSVFGDGKKGRKINVELTAGGGGNTEARKSKIEAKNAKLQEERQREREKREELEAKQQERKDKKEAREKKKNKKDEKKGGKAEAAPAPAEEAPPSNGGMHPARLAMMNAPPPKWQTNRQRY